jgi:hypothetical protein
MFGSINGLVMLILSKQRKVFARDSNKVKSKFSLNSFVSTKALKAQIFQVVKS